MHDGMPYGRNQGKGQGHSREVDRQSPTGIIFFTLFECKICLMKMNADCTSMASAMFQTARLNSCAKQQPSIRNTTECQCRKIVNINYSLSMIEAL